MHRFWRFGLPAFLLIIAVPSGFSQLRTNSDYSYDRINTEKTYFILHDAGAAEFAWASEWTYATVDSNSEKAAMFLWRFKDGSIAYSEQTELLDNMGKNRGFLLTSRSANLEDIHRKKIQPLTRNNYPIKVELWVGQINDSTGYAPEFLGETLCFDAQSIEPDRQYYFSSCESEGK
jgi:hypothetical protein